MTKIYPWKIIDSGPILFLLFLTTTGGSVINLALPAWTAAAIITEGNFSVVMLRLWRPEEESVRLEWFEHNKFQITSSTLQDPNQNLLPKGFQCAPKRWPGQSQIYQQSLLAVHLSTISAPVSHTAVFLKVYIIVNFWLPRQAQPKDIFTSKM